ncbi:30S ribosomal protein S2 [Candidatus Micrarchaeota archaeon]|nr:30S ribosomal protein S2 [Candidatus Micrarchaeota archaeon]
MEENEAENTEERSSFLIPQEKYLETGIHIGTRFKTVDMKQFIFKMRDDGLFILDLRKIDERIRQAAKIIGKYKPEDVLVVASRMYSGNAAEKFSGLTGVGLLKGRFIPGTMTNVNLPGFKEPKLIIVCDPKGEWEAIREAAMTGVPVVALCDTDNNTAFVDWVVPANNKGRRSLAIVFYLLARELMMKQGKIASYDEFDYRTDYFERFDSGESKPKKQPEKEPEAQADDVPSKEASEESAKEESEDVRAKKALAQANESAPKKAAKKPAKKEAEPRKEASEESSGEAPAEEKGESEE